MNIPSIPISCIYFLGNKKHSNGIILLRNICFYFFFIFLISIISPLSFYLSYFFSLPISFLFFFFFRIVFFYVCKKGMFLSFFYYLLNKKWVQIDYYCEKGDAFHFNIRTHTHKYKTKSRYIYCFSSCFLKVYSILFIANCFLFLLVLLFCLFYFHLYV